MNRELTVPLRLCALPPLRLCVDSRGPRAERHDAKTEKGKADHRVPGSSREARGSAGQHEPAPAIPYGAFVGSRKGEKQRIRKISCNPFEKKPHPPLNGRSDLSSTVGRGRRAGRRTLMAAWCRRRSAGATDRNRNHEPVADDEQEGRIRGIRIAAAGVWGRAFVQRKQNNQK
jgi:hypothetical protein